jgi:hypothetical protein
VIVPDPVRAVIVEAYAVLGGLVAVRSSATAEDLPGAAFAGQHDTFLNVIGSDEVVDAVQQCWSSLWTDRAVAYRRRRCINVDDIRMAVVVQAMVPADNAGVLFTANPVTGARDEIVIDASGGLGEAVVSGLVTPDHYVLDASGVVRESREGGHEVVIRGALDGGVTRDSAGTDQTRRLSAEILAELAALGRSIADHFGRLQDIEWAHARGRVWLLQTRPMTALLPPPLRLTRVQQLTGPPILEMLPMRPYPLDVSAWIEPGLGRMVSRTLDEMAGLRVDLSEALPEVDGVVDCFVPPMPHPMLRMLTAPARNLRRLRRHDPAAWEQDPRFAAFEQQVRARAARDVAMVSWDELSRLPRRALDVLDIITDLRVDYLPAAVAALLRLRLILTLLGRTDLFPDLIVGAPTRTTDANRALNRLAGRVRADATLRALFADLERSDLGHRLDDAPEFAEFRGALDAFLAEYGHRETTSVLLVSSPTWSDDPATFLGAVTALIDHPHPGADAARRTQAVEQLLDDPVVRLTRSRVRLTRMVQAARTGIAFREETHFHATRVLPVLRLALLETGRRLAQAGLLADQGDVFHLRLDELEGLADPVTSPDVAHIRRAVRTRAVMGTGAATTSLTEGQLVTVDGDHGHITSPAVRRRGVSYST